MNTSTSTTLLQRSRPWYASVQEWTIYEENIEEQIRTGKLLAAQKPSNQAPQPTVPGSEHLLASSEIVSCPASSNGDIDDDVSSNSASYSLHRSALFSSDAMFAMIHLRISSTTIEKNGIWKTPFAKMERRIIQSAIKMFLPELQTRWAKISLWFAFQIAKNILCRESSSYGREHFDLVYSSYFVIKVQEKTHWKYQTSLYLSSILQHITPIQGGVGERRMTVIHRHLREIVSITWKPPIQVLWSKSRVLGGHRSMFTREALTGAQMLISDTFLWLTWP